MKNFHDFSQGLWFVLNQIKISNNNRIETSINIINKKFQKNTLNTLEEKLDIPIFIDHYDG